MKLRMSYIESEEKRIESMEMNLTNDENQIVTELRKINSKDHFNFKSLEEWKIKVWNECSEKKAHDENKVFFFQCEKTGKMCRYDSCYRNVKN